MESLGDSRLRHGEGDPYPPAKLAVGEAREQLDAVDPFRWEQVHVHILRHFERDVQEEPKHVRVADHQPRRAR